MQAQLTIGPEFESWYRSRECVRAHAMSRPDCTLATRSVTGNTVMNIHALALVGMRDPLSFAVLAYLLGTVLSGALALVIEPLRRARRQ